ncbi:hypothetical protein JOF56_005498 [Kibdelosporangium banguiense]|uniref:DUF948 domain-containing protein n=1 Tax=Kibdelosporangium banguiense TaxID=1365924 RepID=A0ABS4TL11_9PSEU|nr:hypothetical protein [Kibdelosporangium banguiense]MBP2325113.1 hypothetical protein [Kibdelosporangium banguiense]
MTLWWIGAIALIVIVLPVVLVLINRILAALERIRSAADSILADGAALDAALEPVPGLLAETDKTIKEVQVGAVRYAGSVQKLLDG